MASFLVHNNDWPTPDTSCPEQSTPYTTSAFWIFNNTARQGLLSSAAERESKLWSDPSSVCSEIRVTMLCLSWAWGLPNHYPIAHISFDLWIKKKITGLRWFISPERDKVTGWGWASVKSKWAAVLRVKTQDSRFQQASCRHLTRTSCWSCSPPSPSYKGELSFYIKWFTELLPQSTALKVWFL